MSSHVAASYLVERAVFRIGAFFRHWYVDGSASFWRTFSRGANNIEQTLAVRVTAHMLFRPLFGDYSVVGRIIGPFFRLGRLIVGAVAYAVLFIALLIVYICWLVLPALLIWYVIRAAF
jgi:hypothetical protein